MMPDAKILVVDDEQNILDLVTAYLRREGYEVHTAMDGPGGLKAARAFKPDLIVLDIMLPGMDGFEICNRIRAEDPEQPIIMLTAKTSDEDIIQGLTLGADDYVAKPFSPRELAARVNGVLRRAAPRPEPERSTMEFDGLVIDSRSREVHRDGVLVELTPKEFDVLAHLASSPRRVFSRADLLRDVWQSSPDWQDPATVTVHVRRIRNKIEADPESPRWISTVWGVGYRFEP